MKKEIKKVFDKLKTHIKNIWNIACKIHKKSGYLRIYILFDMLWSYIAYSVNYDEYYILSFYDVVSSKRNTYLTYKKHKRIVNFLQFCTGKFWRHRPPGGGACTQLCHICLLLYK